MADTAARLLRALRAAGVAATDVSVGNPADKATWKVDPPSVQASAAPVIAAFNADEPATVDAAMDVEVKSALDDERLISAVVSAIIDQFFPPFTIAKYNAARTKIIAFYKSQPWKP